MLRAGLPTQPHCCWEGYEGRNGYLISGIKRTVLAAIGVQSTVRISSQLNVTPTLQPGSKV